MRVIALTLAALLAPSLSLGQTSQQLIKDFEERENSFARAYQTKDMKRLEQLLAPEYALTVSARPSHPMLRAEWLALIPKYNVQTFEIRGVQVRCLKEAARGRCELAAVSSINTQKADVGGRDRSGEFFIVDIWSYRHGKWMVSARYSGRTEAEVPTLMQKKP
jgi:hypothetical protein